MNPTSRSLFHRAAVAAILASALASTPVAAAPPAPAANPPAALSMATTGHASKDVYDDIWSLATLYKDDENPLLQKLAFTGRAQFDYTYVDADQGELDYWFVRRLRVGFKAQLFEDFTLHAEVDFNPQFADPAYQRLTEANLAWSRDPALVLKLGRQSAEFTLDGHTSSKELIAIDRSNVANNLWFPQEYFPGASASGAIDHWVYFAGVYSSGEASPEFGDFNAGNFGLITLGYDFSEALEVKEALVNFDYVYNEPDAGNTFTRSLRQVGSVNFFYDTGKCGLRGDISAGEGYLGQSDLLGFMIMPFYNVTDKVQVVGRYSHISSEDGTNGVRLARYESDVVAGRGDDFDEFYLGLNYYLYGHKLKLQTGVTYAMMDDDANNGGAYEGWGITSGLRLSW